MTTIEDIRQNIADYVNEGFESKTDIIDSIVFSFSDEYEYDFESLVEKITTELLAEHYRLQREWVSPTDCDKLDTAFETLERSGILARQNYQCCRTCGFSAIWDEMADNEQARGFVFYHNQDTESACDGSGIHFFYGAAVNDTEACTEVGNELIAALEKAGLKPVWNGDTGQRIKIPAFDWKRRRKIE